MIRDSKAQQKKVERWNEKHSVGQEVWAHRDNGEFFKTKTRSEAQLLSGHTAVVWIEGISGCYALSHVEAIV